jgi:long-chain acyl-CoA synthetase
MQQYTTPAIIEPPSSGNLSDPVWENADSDPGAVVFGRRTPDGWTDVTAAEFRDEVAAVAKGLIGAGVKHGDRVALLSATRYEWTLVDYAIWSVGAVTVPIYETSSAEQIEWILSDSEATAAVVETAAQASAIGDVRTWVIESDGLRDLIALGTDVSAETLATRRTAVGPGDLATLIYTSGTTGRPKGCKITHANFMDELGTAVRMLDVLFDTEITKGASTLLFLPLAHVFARIIQVGCVMRRVRLGHTADVKNLVDDLGTFQPTFILSVPRVFEKVFNSASQKAHSAGKGRIFDAAAETAIAYSAADRPGIGLRLRHALFDRLVYGKLRAVLGGRVQYAVSGGAPLGDRLAHFFRGIGVPVLEGYGLTETTAALSVNLPGDQRIGTVGRPLPGVTVAVADDGELLFKGGQVMAGYWKNDEATAAAIDEDGWFHTGDLGEIDGDGFIRITGRKKEILVTAGGKNVAPAVLEDRLRLHPLISQCMVVGDGKPFIAALVTIDPENIGAWASEHGKPADIPSLVDDPDLIAEIQQAVDEANKAVSKAEAIRKFTILPVDWTQETGELSLKLSLRRHVVTENHTEDIEALYA